MIDAVHDARFAPERFGGEAAAAEYRPVRDLDCGAFAELRVHDRVHARHAAAAELALDTPRAHACIAREPVVGLAASTRNRVGWITRRPQKGVGVGGNRG